MMAIGLRLIAEGLIIGGLELVFSACAAIVGLFAAMFSAFS